MQVERLSAWPSTADARAVLRSQWNDLLADCDGVSVFQSFDWNEAWWATFGDPHELLLLRVSDARGAVLAIAPLMLVTQRRFGVEQKLLMLLGTSNHAADYADLIVARGQPRARRAIAEWIAAHRQQWQAIEWRNVPAGSPSLTLFDDGVALPRALREFAAEAPARRLHDPAEDRRVASKKSLRRHLNGFSREGEVQLRRLQSPHDIEQHLEPFFAQHRARWAGTGTPSLFDDPRQRAFYRALAGRLGDSLHFSAVCWQQRVIAYHFGFERDGVFTWYKPSFDPTLSQRSPGEVLIKLLLDQAIDRGLSEFDFTVGSEPFKFRFANVVRRVCRLRLYQRAWQRWPARLRHRLKGWWLAWRGRRAGARPAGGVAGAGTAAR